MATTATASRPDEVPDVDFDTLADLPFHVAGRFQNPGTVGRRRGDRIEAVSSKELFERIRDLSLGLGARGIVSGDRVAIVSESRPEWLMADLAILSGGAVTVPLYPTLSSAQAHYLLNDSGAKAAIVSTRTQLVKIQEVRHKLPALQPMAVAGYDLVDTEIQFESGALAHILAGWALPNSAWSNTVQSGRIICSEGLRPGPGHTRRWPALNCLASSSPSASIPFFP